MLDDPTHSIRAAILDSLLSAPYDRLWLGVNYVNQMPSSPVTVHYDDLFVDTKDVGCP